MARKKSNQPIEETTEQTPKQFSPTETVLLTTTGTGIIREDQSEESEIDWKGKISLGSPGEYWLDGFMRKDTSGVYMELVSRIKEKQGDEKLFDDRGVLFRNSRKRLKHQPDYTGNIAATTPGEYDVHCIIRTSKGVTYMELSLVSDAVAVVEESEMPF